MTDCEITNQVTTRLNDIRASLNSQIQHAISAAIAEKVLPSIQNTLETQGRGNFAVVDRRSIELQGSPGAVNPQKTWENRPKSGFTRKIRNNRLKKVGAERFITFHSFNCCG